MRNAFFIKRGRQATSARDCCIIEEVARKIMATFIFFFLHFWQIGWHNYNEFG